MYKQMTFGDIHNATFSQESEGGATGCDSPDGPTTDQCGQALARANRSVTPENKPEQTTQDTCGLSTSVSLASRLRQKLEGLGSPEYKLTYKVWDMPPLEPIFALRASTPRTSVPASGGWPTPQCVDMMTCVRTLEQRRAAKGGCSNLREVVHLAEPGVGWPTPLASDQRGSAGVGKKELPNIAQIAGWRTPSASDPIGGAKTDEKYWNAKSPKLKLRDTCHLAGYPTPRCTEIDEQPEAYFQRMRDSKHVKNQGKTRPGNVSIAAHLIPGTIRYSFLAKTGSTAALNPGLSRWLMGYPETWEHCSPGFPELSLVLKRLEEIKISNSKDTETQ